MATFFRTFSFPGVQIEPFSGGLRTIDGVETSVTAFIGRAQRGPEDEPVQVTSFTRFQRVFGGLWANSSMSYAVLQYFQNGGSEALIVRVQNGGSAATLQFPGGLKLVASSSGEWGNALRARVEHTTSDTTLFKLTILEPESGATEQFAELSTDRNDPRFVSDVLQRQSKLVRTSGAVPTARPGATGVPATGLPATGAPAGSSIAFNANGNDGNDITDSQISLASLQSGERGLWALEKANDFNLLCIPPLRLAPGYDVNAQTRSAAAAYCRQRRAIYLADPLASWTEAGHVTSSVGLDSAAWGMARQANVALYYPRIMQPDPLQGNRITDFAPSGAVAGVIARTDRQRGIWKAPAGRDATLHGVVDLATSISSSENRQLNSLGVNCLRALPVIGRVVWGARTMMGADQLGSEWKYLSVRRLALHIEESLDRGTRWCGLEPNDETLWSQIRPAVGAFMEALFQQGALQGDRASEAYFVKCGRDTTTEQDISRGIVNIQVGFAPLKPAEFVLVRIQQAAGLPRS